MFHTWFCNRNRKKDVWFLSNIFYKSLYFVIWGHSGEVRKPENNNPVHILLAAVLFAFSVWFSPPFWLHVYPPGSQTQQHACGRLLIVSIFPFFPLIRLEDDHVYQTLLVTQEVFKKIERHYKETSLDHSSIVYIRSSHLYLLQEDNSTGLIMWHPSLSWGWSTWLKNVGISNCKAMI